MPTSNTVNFRELRKNLAGYLRQARRGEEFVITSRGEIVARIVPPAEPVRRPIGLLKGQIHVADDFDVTPVEIIDVLEGGEG
ncbi:MAG: type II toxin-antitoxin system prevent-host-death family antitoxin [Azospirillaceae bacterium]|nr:type II toxin-antitoxin system prevent-host-death family antitoxin [Azospirillaceae bacterium]